MSRFQDIKDLQRLLQGRDFVRLRTAFGQDYVMLFGIFRKVLFVAKKLSRPESGRTSKSYSKCFRLLTEFDFRHDDWDAVNFVEILEQFGPDFSDLFLQIVSGIMNHPGFLAYVEGSRRWFREGQQLVLNPDRRSPYQQITINKTSRVIDSLAGIVVRPNLIG
jgi:hypothetical protein